MISNTWQKLHQYQRDAVEFFLEHKKVYMAVDMGLGKTLIALTAREKVKQPAIVLGPLGAIMSTWPDEIKKWYPNTTYQVIHGPKKSLRDIDSVDILLMNYEGLAWFSKQAVKWKRRMIIYDEASMVKSHSTTWFKLLKKMRQLLWTEYAICLSATPAVNSLIDLWSQYFLLDGGKALERTISDFRSLYCSSFSYPGMSFVTYNVRPEMVPLVHKAVKPITYRLDARDYLDMPERIDNLIYCDLSVVNRRKYDELEKELCLNIEKLGPTEFVEAPTAGALTNKLRQFVQGGVYYQPSHLPDLIEHRQFAEIHRTKLNRLEQIIDTSAGQPVLVAIQFKFELEMIRSVFPKVPVIAGGTPSHITLKYIKQWNKQEIPLLLCHPASLSHGVNLQAGGHILVWYGLPWSLEHYIQLVGRLYRQGQLSAVIVHHLLMRDTIDEAIYESLKQKNSVQQNLLNYLKRKGGLNG